MAKWWETRRPSSMCEWLCQPWSLCLSSSLCSLTSYAFLLPAISSSNLAFSLLVLLVIIFCVLLPLPSSPFFFLARVPSLLLRSPVASNSPSLFLLPSSPVCLSCSLSLSFHHHLLQQSMKNRCYTTLSIIIVFNVKNKITAIRHRNRRLDFVAP